MILTFPAGFAPNRIQWHLEANTSTFMSPLTRSVQTLELAGARWVCDMTFPSMRPEKWRTFAAWLAKMRGQAGRVYFGPPHYTGTSAPRWTPDPNAGTCDDDTITCDSAAGTCDQTSELPFGGPITVFGAGQTGNVLRTEGWVNDITCLQAGDYISYDTTVGRTLHMVVEDAVSDGLGRATITIEGPIRTSPANGAAVEFTQPTCIMTAQDSMSGAPTFTPHLRAAVSLQLVEVF